MLVTSLVTAVALSSGGNHMAMFQRNAPSDLPNNQRAQEIIAEARQRLAASGGKASMLPQMIQRVTAEYGQRDDQQISRPGERDYRQPNNMEAYIDQVLHMSGMAGDNARTSQNAGGDASIPIPTERPTDIDAGTPMPMADDGADKEPDTDADDGGVTFGQVAAGLLGMGGAAALARYLYQNYGAQAKQMGADALSDIDKSINATTGENASGGVPAVVDDGSDAEGEAGKQDRLAPPNKQIGGPDAQLEGPRKQIGAQSDTDAMIESTMSDDDIDNVFRTRVEGEDNTPRPGPNRFADIAKKGDPRIAQTIDQATEMANSGDVRGAVALMRQNGIDIDENMLRTLAAASNTVKSLRSRVGDVAGNAVRRAARP